ncbi:hypothetical protein [Microvirga sp. TS319]|uniref:hypothetical protein n=1 Tax=Microvirga sp. TS319 TaxID=3241165 RepID=UPI00351A88F1
MSLIPNSYSASTVGAAGRRTLIAVRAGENPSFDYFLAPRLAIQRDWNVRVVDGATPPGDVFRDVDPSETYLLFCRYVPAYWRRYVERNHARLIGCGYFVDDDYEALVRDSTVPLRYRWKVWRLGLRPQQALGRVWTHVWAGSWCLADRLSALKAEALLPVAGEQDFARGTHCPTGPLRIAFHATAVHRREHEWLLSLVPQLRAALPQAVFEIVADRSLAGPWQEMPNVVVRKPTPWPVYRAETAHDQADILLVPLLPAPINEVRSSTKLIDAARLGAVPILSDAAPYAAYRDVAPCLSLNQAAWVNAICELARDAAQRQRIMARLQVRLEQTRHGLYPLLPL